jgi:hypothetical protein
VVGRGSKWFRGILGGNDLNRGKNQKMNSLIYCIWLAEDRMPLTCQRVAPEWVKIGIT